MRDKIARIPARRENLIVAPLSRVWKTWTRPNNLSPGSDTNAFFFFFRCSRNSRTTCHSTHRGMTCFSKLHRIRGSGVYEWLINPEKPAVACSISCAPWRLSPAWNPDALCDALFYLGPRYFTEIMIYLDGKRAMRARDGPGECATSKLTPRRTLLSRFYEAISLIPDATDPPTLDHPALISNGLLKRCWGVSLKYLERRSQVRVCLEEAIWKCCINSSKQNNDFSKILTMLF